MSRNAFEVMLSNRLGFVVFLLGKVIRFGLFVLFLVFLVRGAGALAGYSVEETVFFYLTFNLIDVLGQFLFREVYRFKPQVVSGSFDLVLSKPSNALFRSLMGGVDVIDLVTIPPLIAGIVYVGAAFSPSLAQIVLYIVLVLNGLLIAAAFHIAVLGIGIITYAVDHAIHVYRDVLNLGRLPIEIYRQPVRGALTFFIPVAIMISLPAKSLIGVASVSGLLTSFAIGAAAVFISLKFWNYAVSKYTSASS